MNKVLFQDQFGHAKELEMTSVPRKGDKVLWRFDPPPTVVAVVWSLSAIKDGVDVIVYLD